jgi:putative chitinase
VITLEQLRAICPSTGVPLLVRFVEPLAETAERYELVTPARKAMFLAQYAHETGGFQKLTENLYYTSVDALLASTKPHWDALDADDAWGYLQQPERLANRVYANRMGNGDEASGDGWRYRGRGLPHLTGARRTTQACGPAIGSTWSRTRTCCSRPGRRASPAAGSGRTPRATSSPIAATSAR